MAGRKCARGTRKPDLAYVWFEELKRIDRELQAPRSVESWLAYAEDRQRHMAAMPAEARRYVG